jgi:uncharacterized protein (TIRG00374 family)
VAWILIEVMACDMVRQSVRGKQSAILRWAAAVLLAVAAVWFSVRQVQWELVGITLSQARLGLLGLALSTVLATTAAKALRWRLLLLRTGSRARILEVLRALLIGQLGNILLPMRLGDVARAAVAAPTTPGGIPTVLGTILVEKVMDGAMGLLVLTGLALWTPLPSWLRGPFLALALTTAAVGTVLLAATYQQEQTVRLIQALTRSLPGPARSRLAAFLTDLSDGLDVIRGSGTAWAAGGWTSLVWVLGGLTNFVTLLALGIQAPPWSVWLVLATGYVANFLPSVPGQVGVFEFAAVLALTTAGVVPAQALAFALVLHLVVYAPPVVLGSASMAYEGVRWSSLGTVSSVATGDSGDHR